MASSSSSWLTTVEVAKLLRVHPKHVYRLLKQGLPARRVGGQWRFSKADVKGWSAQRGQQQLHAESSSPSFAPSQRALIHHVPSKGPAGPWIAGTPSFPVQLLLDRVNFHAPRLGWINADGPSMSLWVQDGLILVGASVSPRNPTGDQTNRATSALVRVHAGVFVPVRAPSSVPAAFGDGLVSCNLMVRPDQMSHPVVTMLCALLQSEEMRAELAGLGVVNPQEVGKIAYPRIDELEQDIARDGTSSDTGVPSRFRFQVPSSRAQARFVLLLRDKGVRTDQELTGFAARLSAQGVGVGGFVQVPRIGPRGLEGYDLLHVGSGQRVRLATRKARAGDGGSSRMLEFEQGSFERAWTWLRQDVTSCEVLIVDGVAGLELEGAGHFDAIDWIRRRRGKLVILSLRRKQAPTLDKKLHLRRRALARVDLAQSGPVLDTLAGNLADALAHADRSGGRAS